MKSSTLWFVMFVTLFGNMSAYAIGGAHPCWGSSAQQDVMGVNIDKGNAVRHKSYYYQAPNGYKICFATTNEISSNPKSPQKQFFNKSSKSTQFSIHLPCPGNGIPPAAIGAIGGMLLCGASGGASCILDAAGGTQIVAEISGNQCGVGGSPNWFEGNVVFILFPEGESCPNAACQAPLHPAPFEPF